MSSRTAKIGLIKYAIGDDPWDFDNNFDYIDSSAPVSGLAVVITENPSTTLRVKVNGGGYRVSDGTAGSYAGVAVVTLSDNTATAVWLTDVGVLTTGASYPGSGYYVPLGTVTTLGGIVTAIRDDRVVCDSVGTSGATATQTANLVFSGPTTGAAAIPTFRLLVAADIPNLDAAKITTGTLNSAQFPTTAVTAGSYSLASITIDATGRVTAASNGVAGTGTVTSVNATTPASLFTVSGGPITSSGTLAFAAASSAPNLVVAGPTSGGSAALAPRALVVADFPNSGVTPGSYTVSSITVDAQGRITAASSGSAAGTGTVTSVGLSLPSILTVSGSPVTSTGTLTAVLASQAQNTIFVGPIAGSGTPTFRAMTAGDLPATAVTAGVYTAANVTIDAQGRITAAANGVAGTVASVAMTVPSFLAIAGTPITSSGTLAVTLATQLANVVFAGPTSGGAVAPTWRALVAADVPSLDYSKITTGTISAASLPATAVTAGSYSLASITVDATGRITAASNGSSGTGTVTSVAMTVPSFMTITGSPVTTSGTLAITMPSALPIANGGTGQVTAIAGFNALSPMTTNGDMIWGGGSGGANRLAGNITTAKQFLTSTGTGTASTQPLWGTIANADLPTSGATAASYTNANITVNAQGVITAASNGTGGSGGTPSGTDGQLQFNHSSAFANRASFGTPTVAVGFAGSGATASVSGSDVGGVITLTPGTPVPTSSTNILTLTFNTTWSTAPKAIILVPANANANASSCYVDAANISTTQFTITSGVNGLNGTSSAYKFNYLVIV